MIDVLRRIFCPNSEEVTKCRRNIHYEELHNLHCALHIIRMIKSRLMRWAGHVHVAHMGQVRSASKILARDLKSPLGRPGLRRIILKWILKTECLGVNWVL
jgi:hypothetical protein